MKNKQLVRRIGTSENMVNAMFYLCSDWSSFVTRETFESFGWLPPLVP
jgi:NAD(P)-dependent dehydrogenase (short-subunit alcohol dehydrogenase family)